MWVMICVVVLLVIVFVGALIGAFIILIRVAWLGLKGKL